MEFLGYAASALMGIVLGLLGGGGSILTLPILTYLFKVPASEGAAYSLFIVGLTALMASIGYLRRGEAPLGAALGFGLPSIVAVYLTRAFIVPALPETLLTLGALKVSRDQGILILFAVLMVAAAVAMLRPSKHADEDRDAMHKPRLALIAVEGLVVGVLTGLVGAGGGFLIIPALVHLAKMPMKKAVGASLIIIAAKSLTGFVGDLQGASEVNWPLLLGVSGLAIVGSFVGVALSSRISGAKLKPAFGVLVLVMGSAILVGEVISAAR